MHFEVELALIIGKMVRDLKADDRQGALEAIKGMFFFFYPFPFFFWLKTCEELGG